MFGYVKTYLPELRVRENETYRAVYCGLCRSLGRCTGCASRLTLNYDFVFAALLIMAANGEAPTFSVRRCAAHPIKKRPMANPNVSLDFCAGAGILLAYRKTDDDIADEHGSKRFRAKLLRGSMRGMHRRAVKRLGEADVRITERLAGLSEIESRRLPSVDIPADCFGKLLGELLASGADAPYDRVLKNAGFHLGRWLYIIDAADDFAEDIKKQRFNPFVCLYGEEPFDEQRKTDIFNALTAELIELEKAVDLLPHNEEQRDIYGIIDNILRLGMPDAAHRVLYGEKGRSDERPL